MVGGAAFRGPVGETVGMSELNCAALVGENVGVDVVETAGVDEAGVDETGVGTMVKRVGVRVGRDVGADARRMQTQRADHEHAAVLVWLLNSSLP